MIPYIKVPDFPLGPLTLHPFGILVATGVLVTSWLATRRARALGYDLVLLNSFGTWMLLGGFIGGHVFDSLFYHWGEVMRRPQSLLLLWEGLSSFGGFLGATLGAILWKYLEIRRHWVRLRKAPMPIFPFANLVHAVFPVGWAFGRGGCSVVHDHPGARATAETWLAVAYPGFQPEAIDGPGTHRQLGFVTLIDGLYPRYDLGLLELMFTVVLAICFALTWRRRLAVGTYLVVVCLAYAPVRFAMDFLRIPETQGGDARYASLTPAQWSCVVLVLTAAAIGLYMRSLRRRGIDVEAPVRATSGNQAAVLEPGTE